MYDRAPRAAMDSGSPWIVGGNQSAGCHLGPGAYSEIKLQRREAGFAPFLSTRGRESFLELEVKDPNPGPGHYEMAGSSNGNGTSFGKNRTERFQDFSTDVPGPGHYPVNNKTDMRAPGKGFGPVSNNTARADSFEWVRKKAPPSIPAAHQSFGYEEGPAGYLIGQQGPDHDSQGGPAFYSIESQFDAAKRSKRGIDFGKSRAKRCEFRGKEGPSPAAYLEHQVKPDGVDVGGPHQEQRQTHSFASRATRYHQMVPANEAKKDVPGPGTYQLRSQFDKKKRNKFQNFGSTSKRLVGAGDPSDRQALENTKTPGPGTYDELRTAFIKTTPTPGGTARGGTMVDHPTPFGTTANRFDARYEGTPGPGSYNNAETESFTKAILNRTTGCKGVFGGCSNRFPGKRQHCGPGPGQYNPNTTSFATNVKGGAGSAFKSQSDRLQEAPLTDGPPANIYDVTVGAINKQGKSGSKAPFNSSKDRSHKTDFNVRVDPENPGPGNYQLKSYMTKGGGGGAFISRDSRFHAVKSETPGPQYSVGHNLLRKSYNVSLYSR